MARKDHQLFVAYVGTTKFALLKAKVGIAEPLEVAALSARLAHGFEEGC